MDVRATIVFSVHPQTLPPCETLRLTNDQHCSTDLVNLTHIFAVDRQISVRNKKKVPVQTDDFVWRYIDRNYRYYTQFRASYEAVLYHKFPFSEHQYEF